MIQARRDRYYNRTVEQAVADFPGELDVDAVGLWQIVPAGRDGFGFEGLDLNDFIRRCIHALIDAGAVPVKSGKGTDYEWIAQEQYGKSKESIAEAVIAEWLKAPDDQDVLFRVWFARPRPGRKYVKIG
jgi:hypothetical protein